MSFDFFGIHFREKRIRICGRVFKISVMKQLIVFAIVIIFCVIIGFAINNNDIITENASSSKLKSSSLNSNTSNTLSPSINNTAAPITSTAPTTPPAPTPNDLIMIHISGAVASPGVVTVQKNARIADVIKVAGGLTEKCDLSEINLAAYALDGMKVHIPHLGETPSYVLPNYSPLPTSTSTTSSEALQTGPYEKININTATLPQLMQLNGIGEATAQKIIAYRKEHGFFTKIEDILLVSGIGTNKYNDIKNYICI